MPSVSAAGIAPLPLQRWQIAPADTEAAAALGAVLGLSPLIAQLLINRGIDDPEAARTYLAPEQLVLPDPREEFEDLVESLLLLEEAIAERVKIAICGDYDADGMTSTALLLRALRNLGATVDYAIPSRMTDGYGINRRIVEEFAADGVGLILTVDNGIAANDAIARARELGLAVIITDHHDLPPQLPPANAILNPKLLPPESPYAGLAGVGVAYVLAICLAQQLERLQDFATPLLELFTLGTIADLAPLTGVNRRWVQRGLRRLPQSQNPGIQALMLAAGVEPRNSTLRPEDIGFRLGPRINAIGRIGDPQIVIDLLTTDHWAIAQERANDCEHNNSHRKALCERIEREAVAWVEQQGFDPEAQRVLLVVQPDWHHGVIGIVASRLVERFGVPVFIGTPEGEGMIRGSARSIPEFNVFEALEFSKDLLHKHGGHRAAGGFSLAEANLKAFGARLSEFGHQCLTPDLLRPLVTVDVELPLAQASLDLFEAQQQLQPFGIGNPEPVYWSRDVRIVDQKPTREGTHLQLQVQSEGMARSLKAIAWRWGEYHPLPEQVDIAYKLSENVWKGERSLQLEILGVRPATAAATWIELDHGGRRYRVQRQGTAIRLVNAQEQTLHVPAGASTAWLSDPGGDRRELDLNQPFLQGLLAAAEAALSL